MQKLHDEPESNRIRLSATDRKNFMPGLQTPLESRVGDV